MPRAALPGAFPLSPGVIARGGKHDQRDYQQQRRVGTRQMRQPDPETGQRKAARSALRALTDEQERQPSRPGIQAKIIAKDEIQRVIESSAEGQQRGAKRAAATV